MTAHATAITPPTQPASAADRVIALRSGDRRALAAAVTDLECLSALAPALLQALQPHLGHALVIGITGPPGAGKSTLVNALITCARSASTRVAVIAVDPSSPISGGSILGDRIRMTAAHDDEGVYVRSLASHGHLGGLSPAAVRIIDALDAAGFDLVFLETVGTGQNEIDVAEIADIRVVVAAPGLGDDIQAMKSGLLEIADILVVNKGDRDDAERTVHQLMGALSIRATGQSSDGQSSSVKVPVLKTTAATSDGVDVLLKAILDLGLSLPVGGLDRRRRRARYLIERAAQELVRESLSKNSGHPLQSLADDVLSGLLSPSDAAKHLLARS